MGKTIGISDLVFCNKPQIYELLVPVLHCTVCKRPWLSKVQNGGLQICDVRVRISIQRFYNKNQEAFYKQLIDKIGPKMCGASAIPCAAEDPNDPAEYFTGLCKNLNVGNNQNNFVSLGCNPIRVDFISKRGACKFTGRYWEPSYWRTTRGRGESIQCEMWQNGINIMMCVCERVHI